MKIKQNEIKAYQQQPCRTEKQKQQVLRSYFQKQRSLRAPPSTLCEGNVVCLQSETRSSDSTSGNNNKLKQKSNV